MKTAPAPPSFQIDSSVLARQPQMACPFSKFSNAVAIVCKEVAETELVQSDLVGKEKQIVPKIDPRWGNASRRPLDIQNDKTISSLPATLPDV